MFTKLKILKDKLEVIFGRRHYLTPPRRYDYINIGDHDQIGEEFFQLFLDYGKLKPTHQVLEIGSGFGRMAIPLTKFLKRSGSYDGIEIIQDGYNWCRSNFTPKFPNFNFHLIDVYNERYNPKGKYLASEIKFPFRDDTFDFIFLTSVFTHMYAQDIENYLNEIKRVLKSNGRVLMTFYILNKEATKNLKDGNATYTFSYNLKNFYIEDPEDPLFQIAYKEEYLRKIIEKCELSIIEPVYFGNWSGKSNNLSFQDVVIAE